MILIINARGTGSSLHHQKMWRGYGPDNDILIWHVKMRQKHMSTGTRSGKEGDLKQDELGAAMIEYEDREREQELVDLPREGFQEYDPDSEQAGAGPGGNEYDFVVGERRGHEKKSNGRERRTQGKAATGKAASERQPSSAAVLGRGARERQGSNRQWDGATYFVHWLMHHGFSK